MVPSHIIFINHAIYSQSDEVRHFFTAVPARGMSGPVQYLSVTICFRVQHLKSKVKLY